MSFEDDGRSFVSDERLARLKPPPEKGTTLPSIAYTDQRFLDLERCKLFANTWMLAGFVEQLPGPGDIVPVSVGGMPLLLARNRNREVRVFHNVCRHRGALLVDTARQNCERITCPYHAWTYDLDGRLGARAHLLGPGEHEPHAPVELGLVPVRFQVWQGLVFVNLNGEAVPFAHYIAPADRVLGDRDLTRRHYAGSLDFEIHANWKLVHENYFDMWHPFHIHPALARLSPYERGQDRRTLVDGDCIWARNTIAAPQDGRGAGLPVIEGLAPNEGIFIHLFPSTNLHVWPENVAVFQVEPTAPAATFEQIHLFFSPAAMETRYEKTRQTVFRQWEELNHEDIAPLERMQRGRYSPGFDGGMLSQYWDGAVQAFAHRVASAVRR